MSIAFLFRPAESRVGMGRNWCGQAPGPRRSFPRPPRFGFPGTGPCFAGPQEELNQTRYTQPALLTVEVACLRFLRNRV